MSEKPVRPAQGDGSGAASDAHDERRSNLPASRVEDATPAETPRPKEYGGPKGLEPVRYGDWEKNGRCIDF